MSIWSEAAFEWHGETYTVTPTMSFINSIEQMGGLFKFMQALSSGDMPLAMATHVLTTALNHAGKRVKPEDIFKEYFSNTVEFATAVGVIIAACFPESDDKQVGKPKPTGKV